MLLLFAAPFSVLILGVLYFRAREAPPAVMTLGVIAPALLLLTIPIPLLCIKITETFQNIASTGGTNSIDTVAQLLSETDSTLWWGSVAVGAIVFAAVLRQLLHHDEAPQSLSQPVEEVPVGSMTWREWTMASAPALAFLITALGLLLFDVPRLLAGPGLDLVIHPESAVPADDLSQRIATRLVTGTLAGAGLSFVVGLIAIGLPVIAPDARAARALPAAALVLATVVIVAAIANTVRLGEELEWIRERAQLAASVQATRPTISDGDAQTTVVPARPPGRAFTPAPQDNAPPERNAPGLTIKSLRTNGAYRSVEKIGDTYQFWIFKADGRCTPAADPSEVLTFVPPPLPAGLSWHCRDVDGSIALSFSGGNVTETIRGAIMTRDHIRLAGVDYRFQSGR